MVVLRCSNSGDCGLEEGEDVEGGPRASKRVGKEGHAWLVADGDVLRQFNRNTQLGKETPVCPKEAAAGGVKSKKKI